LKGTFFFSLSKFGTEYRARTKEDEKQVIETDKRNGEVLEVGKPLGG